MRNLKVPDAGVLHAELTASESTHACYGRMHRAGCPLSGASVSRADDGHWAQSCRAARLQVAGNCRCVSGITATYRISMRPRRLVLSAASGSDSAGQTALGKVGQWAPARLVAAALGGPWPVRPGRGHLVARKFPPLPLVGRASTGPGEAPDDIKRRVLAALASR